MKLLRLCVLIVASFVLHLSAQAAPVEAYAQLPSMQFVRISPDGQRIAFFSTVGDQRVVVIHDLSGKAKPIAIPTGKSRANGLSWAGNDHVVITLSSSTEVSLWLEGPKQVFPYASVYDLTSGKITNLAPQDHSAHVNFVHSHPDVRMVNGSPKVFFNPYIMVFGDDGNRHGRPALYSFDPKTGVTTRVLDATRHSRTFHVDPNGQPLARTTYDGRVWKLQLYRDNTWGTVLTEDVPSKNHPVVCGFGATADSLLILWPNKDAPEEASRLRELRIKNEIEWAPDRDQNVGNHLIEDSATGLTFGEFRRNEGYSFYEPFMKRVWPAIRKAFPNEAVEYISASSDRKKVIVEVFGATSGATYRLVDLNTGIADFIGNKYENVPPNAIASVRSLVYPAADGYLINAKLTLPNGLQQKKNLPLIVVLHSQFESQSFDWLPQALASRGYAVLQPPDRTASSAEVAAYRSRGRKMQTDISDGIRFLASNHTIDPKRVCIVGNDYGGYAALSGVIFEQNTYRCAISIGGIADVEAYWDWLRYYRHTGTYKSAQRLWGSTLGIDGESDKSLSAFSPTAQAHKTSAPVLLIHGEDDTVIPPKQSQLMADALKKAGKPVEFVSLKGEDHYLAQSETRSLMLLETVRFLEINNPPDTPGQLATVQP